MYAYQYPQLSLLYDLINGANPGFDPALSSSNVTLSSPAAATPPSGGTIQDTSLLASAVSGGVYHGKDTFYYRRIDLSKFFFGMKPTINLWLTTTTMPIATVVAQLNALYGLALTVADFSIASLSPGTTSVTIISSSLAYKGTFSVTWNKLNQPISNKITATDLGGRQFPWGSAVSAPAKQPGEYLFYGVDFTSIAPNLANLNGKTLTAASGTDQNALLIALQNARHDLTITNGLASSGSGGIAGLVLKTIAIPSTTLPFANSTKFANCAYLAGTSNWFQGNLLLHYNPH